MTAEASRADCAPSLGFEDAVIQMRFVGHCAMCDRIVVREPDGSCPAGHPAESITGRLMLAPGDPVPVLPAFNFAAFLIPPIWGPFHGQWIGAVFLPLWLFLDSIIGSAGAGGMGTRIASVVAVGATLAFQAFFAKRANGLAWRRVAEKVPVADYARREWLWAIASAPVAAALLGWAVWYDLVLARGAR